MKRFLVPYLPSPQKPTRLSSDEVLHATKVLRLKSESLVEATDGQGDACFARLIINGKNAELVFHSELKSNTQQIIPLHIELSILKGDAMAWAIEKSTELGIQTLTPVLTQRTVVQTKDKGLQHFQERWQKIADQSLKQCGRHTRMEICQPLPLDELLNTYPACASAPRLFCDELLCTNLDQNLLSEKFLDQTLMRPAQMRVLIGPEGGWDSSDRTLIQKIPQSHQAHTHPIALGPLTLRAETAVVFASSVISSYYRYSFNNPET